MLSPNVLKSVLLVGLITMLLTLGLGLALRSGVVNLSTGQGMRRLVENVYQTVVLLVACLVGLVFIQQCIGLKTAIPW
jgi:hypothetical protein